MGRLSRIEFAAGDAPPRGRLHRALRTDVPLRLVGVAAADAAAREHVYEVVREDGEPEGAGGAVLIWPFEVPADDDERFLAAWDRLHELLAPCQGRLGTRLHRSRGPADFRFVEITRWSSPLMYARALRQPEIDDAIAALPSPGRPALYLPADV